MIIFIRTKAAEELVGSAASWNSGLGSGALQSSSWLFVPLPGDGTLPEFLMIPNLHVSKARMVNTGMVNSCYWGQ